jgi:cytochrome P450
VTLVRPRIAPRSLCPSFWLPIAPSAELFVPQPAFKLAFSIVSPSGLLIIDGPTWKRHRKLAQSAFLPNSLRQVLTVTNQMMDKAIDKWGANLGAERELHAELSAFTLDVVAATSFSVDLNTFEDTTSHSTFLSLNCTSMIAQL